MFVENVTLDVVHFNKEAMFFWVFFLQNIACFKVLLLKKGTTKAKRGL